MKTRSSKTWNVDIYTRNFDGIWLNFLLISEVSISARPFVRPFVRSWIPSFFHYFVRSLARSLGLSFVISFVQSFRVQLNLYFTTISVRGDLHWVNSLHRHRRSVGTIISDPRRQLCLLQFTIFKLCESIRQRSGIGGEGQLGLLQAKLFPMYRLN